MAWTTGNKVTSFAALALFAAPLVAMAAEETPALMAPRTRLEVKKAVEDQKQATPRIPLPPLEPGEPSGVNNGRMQRYYLPPEWRRTSLGGRSTLRVV